MRIAVLSSSVREGRLSHRVALWVKDRLSAEEGITAELLDLKAYAFPLFDERFAFQKHPSAELLDFTERFVRADGVLIVSPVYNAGFPAALKNAIDLYYEQWQGKPAAVVSVTSGQVPGIATVQALQTLLLKLGAWVVPAGGTVIDVGRTFSETGAATDEALAEKLLQPTLRQLQWIVGKTKDGK